VTTAHDNRADTEAAWSDLDHEERVKAVERYPGWLELAQRAGRTKLAGLPVYLRERRFDFVDHKGQAGRDGAAPPAVFSDAYSRPWWYLVHRYLEANRELLADVRGQAAIGFRKISDLAVKGIGYRLSDPSKRPEIEVAAADLAPARKDDPAVKIWVADWQRRGVNVPLPAHADWVFVPAALTVGGKAVAMDSLVEPRIDKPQTSQHKDSFNEAIAV